MRRSSAMKTPVTLALLLLAGAAAAAPDENPAFGGDAPDTAADIAALPKPAGPLPADESPAGLYAALGEADRKLVDDGMKVVTFDERVREAKGRTELLGVSIGTLRQPPDAVRSVLASLNDYPTWLKLHPSYKLVRTEGSSRLIAGIGSSDAPKSKRTMTYTVETTPTGARWVVVDSGTPLLAGSSLTFEVMPHPSIEGASLVVHRQVGFLDGGRMLKYLASDDSKGQNRWWKDSNRHARRLQWALDAAITDPPGSERERAYIAHYQREFRGKVPYWAR